MFADAHQIQQVLLNLVINAEQAMLAANGRGSLVMRTWHDVDHEAVVLQVSDDGPGIPVEVKSKIFDPFFTTKETGKGTGLGLTVAYAIVQEHGGSIRVESSRRRWRFFHCRIAGERRRNRYPSRGVRLQRTAIQPRARRCCWWRMSERWPWR